MKGNKNEKKRAHAHTHKHRFVTACIKLERNLMICRFVFGLNNYLFISFPSFDNISYIRSQCILYCSAYYSTIKSLYQRKNSNGAFECSGPSFCPLFSPFLFYSFRHLHKHNIWYCFIRYVCGQCLCIAFCCYCLRSMRLLSFVACCAFVFSILLYCRTSSRMSVRCRYFFSFFCLAVAVYIDVRIRFSFL